MRVVRSLLFWLHLTLGLTAGALILLMSVTGVMLGFERQMIAWIDGAPRVEPTEAGALPLDTLLSRAGVQRADVASITVKRDAVQPIQLRMRERGPAVQVDPYRGEVVTASGEGKGQAFFSALRRWHRWIGASGGELRARTKLLNGTANLIFLGLVLSGLYLWWPRRWTLARMRATLIPSARHHAGHVRDFNWHNSLGFWSAIPLAIIVATGAFFSFRWPGQMLDATLGSPSEKVAARAALRGEEPARPAPREGQSPAEAAFALPEASLAAYVDAAVALHPEWAQLTLALPMESDVTLRVTVAEGNTYRPDLRTTLTLDRSSAALAATSGYADLSTARKLRSWVRFGHTGEVFGIPGQIIATLVSGVGVILVWTGFALAFRRARQWARARRRRSVPRVSPLPNPAFEPPTATR